jgi:hypothetical protein
MTGGCPGSQNTLPVFLDAGHRGFAHARRIQWRHFIHRSMQDRRNRDLKALTLFDQPSREMRRGTHALIARVRVGQRLKGQPQLIGATVPLEPAPAMADPKWEGTYTRMGRTWARGMLGCSSYGT